MRGVKKRQRTITTNHACQSFSSKTKAAKDQSTRLSKGDKTFSSSSKDILLSKAPVVPFDMDLYYWENPSELKPITKAP